MKKFIKIFCTLFLALPCLWFIISLAIYRLPSSQAAKTIEEEVLFKMVDLDLSHRGQFESLLGNRTLHLVESETFYITPTDHSKLWATSPFELQKQAHTYRITVEVQPLLFKGFGLAKIIKIETIPKDPIISK